LKDTVTRKRQKGRNNTQTPRKIWVNFTYHSPLIRNIPNMFKHTNVSIAYRATNNLFNKLQNLQETQDKFHTSGIYKLTWRTCNLSYGTQDGLVDNSYQIRRAPKIHPEQQSRISLCIAYLKYV